MSSLPILSSQTPNNGKIAASASGNSAPTAEDIANGAAPFGELLAKQLNPQGRDAKADILKSFAQADNDKLAAELAATTIAVAGEVRTDGVAPAADFLASLLPQERRTVLAGTQEAPTDIASEMPLSGKEWNADAPPTARNAPAAVGDDNAAAHIGDNAQDKKVSGREDRANGGNTTSAAFAAGMQAEDKTVVRTAANGKTESPILQPLTANTTATAFSVPTPQTAGATHTAVAQATVSTPLHQPQWGEDFSQKVTWLATQRTQSAELHLNPAQLGPLEISLKLHGDQATLQFTSAHAAVRDAIEQSIPRLRDMLADSGISLGNTTVSDQAPREQQRDQASGMRGNGNTDNAIETDLPLTQTTTPLRRHDGVVDTFA